MSSENSYHARSGLLSEGRTWKDTKPVYESKESQATMGHYTMASVPRHIRIDHPLREVFYSQGKKCFAPRTTYQYKGKIYNGTKELQDAIGIHDEFIHQIIKRGHFNGEPIVKLEKRQKTVRVKWNGQEYESIRDFADVHQISLDSAKAMLSRGLLLQGLPVERIPNE